MQPGGRFTLNSGLGRIDAKTGPILACSSTVHVGGYTIHFDASGYVIISSPKVFARGIFCQEDYGSLLTDGDRGADVPLR